MKNLPQAFQESGDIPTLLLSKSSGPQNEVVMCSWPIAEDTGRFILPHILFLKESKKKKSITDK